MTAWVAVLDLAFLAVAFGLRTAIQRRRTGDSGWRLGRPSSVAEAGARIGMVGGAVLLGISLFQPHGSVPSWLAAIASVVAVAAIVGVTVAQLEMGESWRIGVDLEERTALVRSGVYAHVRNPIYTGMAAFAVCHAVLIPSPWSIAGAVAMAIGVEVQVRGVEEPYLARVHGDEYAAWARRSGRFLPRLG